MATTLYPRYRTMADDRANRINHAVRTCLDRCCAAENHLVAIGIYLDELRAGGEFNEHEIASVRMLVSRLRRQLASDVDHLSE